MGSDSIDLAKFLGLLAEIGSPHFRVRGERGGVVAQRDSAVLHHIAAMAHFQREHVALLSVDRVSVMRALFSILGWTFAR